MGNNKFITAALLLMPILIACNESNFSSEGGTAARCVGPSCDPVSPTTTPTTTPTTPPTTTPAPTTPDQISTDNGRIPAVVDAQLKITLNGDGAHFQNCLFANILGQAPADLGCNRPGVFPAKYGTLPVPNASIKVMTNTCNVLSLKLRTNSGAGLKDNVSTTTSPTRFIITKTGPGQFNIKANDNGDNNWNDLNLTIKADNNVKYTIENSNIPCDP